MDNRLIFLYHVFFVITEGGTGKDRRTQALVVLGQPGRTSSRKIRSSYVREGMSVTVRWQVVDAMPPRKASREKERARTKTDTGRQVEHTKEIERTLVKELGKIVP
jgi:hypothetical protein